MRVGKIITWTLLGLLIFFMFIVVIGLIGAMGYHEFSKNEKVINNTIEKETSTIVIEEELDNVYNLNETFTSKYCNITMTSMEEWEDYNEYWGPKDGSKFVRMFFNFKNLDNKDVVFGSYEFKCYANNTIYTAYVLANETHDMPMVETISSGREIEGWIYFEIPVEAELTEIELEYDLSYWSNEKIIFKLGE